MIAKIIVTIGLSILSWFGYHEPTQTQQTFQVGTTFTPVQASQFVLSGAGITSSATTIQVTSFTLPDPQKTPLTMDMFGQIGYAVLEPQTNKIENVSFTGVTQNANGTALLTGVTRGINFVSPYNSSASRALSHAGGSYLILSNSAAFYGREFLFANNTGTSSAVIVLASTSPWRYDFHPTFTLGTQLIDKAYADGLSFSGVATATESSFGGAWLGTALQQASSTNGAPDKPYLLQTKNATSTPLSSCDGTANAGALCAVIALNSGKISPLWLNGSNEIYSINQMKIGSSTVSTSTIGTLNVGKIFSTSTINVLAGNNVASSSVLMNDTSGNLTFGSPQWSYLNASPSNINTTASTTITDTFLPGKSLGTSGYVEFTIPVSNQTIGSTNTQIFEVSYGVATSVISIPWTAGASPKFGMLRVFIVANGATNSQKLIFNLLTAINGGVTSTETLTMIKNSTISTDSTVTQHIMILGRTAGAGEVFMTDAVMGSLHR